jgi:hypothetical protein
MTFPPCARRTPQAPPQDDLQFGSFHRLRGRLGLFLGEVMTFGQASSNVVGCYRGWQQRSTNLQRCPDPILKLSVAILLLSHGT